MTVARELVWEALLAKWPKPSPGVTGFKTITRRWQAWQDDPTQLRPALPLLVQYEMGEDTKDTTGLPPVRTWDARILIYCVIPEAVAGPRNVPDFTTPGASVLNPLIDAVEAAILPPASPEHSGDMDGCQTLGGLVFDCSINGRTIKIIGDVVPDGICGAIIPIRIIVP